MHAYTVTITPRDEPGSAAVVTVEIDNSAPRITRLELVATPGTSLTKSQLRAVDLEKVLFSVLPGAEIVGQRAEAVSSQPAAIHGHASVRTNAASALKRRPTGKAAARRAANEGDHLHQARDTGTRSYRRMPGDFAEVFARDPRAATVAGHYDVPVHTAIGWIRTARRRGELPPARSRRA